MSSRFLAAASCCALLGPIVLGGCNADRSVRPVPEERFRSENEIRYSGHETDADVHESIRRLKEASAEAARFFTDEVEQDAIQALRAHKSGENDAIEAWYGAYASHYVRTSTDTDLWLEYKWWTGGGRQSYHFETPIWAIYWAVKVCYGGRITNWYWMEGSYQRVTAVVGSCLYVPFGDAFLRSYLRVVT